MSGPLSIWSRLALSFAQAGSSYEFQLTYARVGKTAAHKEAKRTQKESTEARESRQMQRESWTWATHPNAEHANQPQEEVA